MRMVAGRSDAVDFLLHEIVFFFCVVDVCVSGGRQAVPGAGLWGDLPVLTIARLPGARPNRLGGPDDVSGPYPRRRKVF